jgi:hypothetical protein
VRGIVRGPRNGRNSNKLSESGDEVDFQRGNDGISIFVIAMGGSKGHAANLMVIAHSREEAIVEKHRRTQF